MYRWLIHVGGKIRNVYRQRNRFAWKKSHLDYFFTVRGTNLSHVVDVWSAFNSSHQTSWSRRKWCKISEEFCESPYQMYSVESRQFCFQISTIFHLNARNIPTTSSPDQAKFIRWYLISASTSLSMFSIKTPNHFTTF